jgi:Recombinase
MLTSESLSVGERGANVEREPFSHDEGEQQALDRIRQLRRKPRGDRCSFGSVATALNKEAIPTRHGKPWTRATVQKICAANGWE